MRLQPLLSEILCQRRRAPVPRVAAHVVRGALALQDVASLSAFLEFLEYIRLLRRHGSENVFVDLVKRQSPLLRVLRWFEEAVQAGDFCDAGTVVIFPLLRRRVAPLRSLGRFPYPLRPLFSSDPISFKTPDLIYRS